MDFFDAIRSIRRQYPQLDESELRTIMDSEIAAEESRLSGARKYARAVETTHDRVLAWLGSAWEYRVNPSNTDDLCRFITSHRLACVWCVLRGQQISVAVQS